MFPAPINLSIPVVLALLGFSALASAETVRLYFDPAIPQIAFAAGDIESALESQSYRVETFDLDALEKSASGKNVILALASDKKVRSTLEAESGKPVPALAEQAYALRTTSTPDRSYWVLGGDANGAMYGGLQLAENIQFHNLAPTYDEEESPHLKNRGVKFNIPLDVKSPTYFYNSRGTSHQVAIPHMWDMSFWQTWFDEMARHRYNVLSLWSPHPFTSMLNMSDYPDVAIQGVQGYDEQGKPTRINDMSIDEKIRFWQDVMKYGRDRGFHIYFSTWNIFLSTAKDKYGLTTDPGNEKTRTYIRECTRQFLETYPDLAGLGITVGEKMGDINDREKEEWAWDTYGRGMMEYALENPQRDLTFIHRQHDGHLDDILDYFTPLNELPNVRLDLSFKYSQAHAHAAVQPSYWNRKKMGEALDQRGLKSWLTVRNDDFFFLHWADPQFVRDYVRGFPEVGKYVESIYIGADGWVFSRDFTSKSPYYREKNSLSIQKTWLQQKIWGRISYNPDVADELFKNHLALKFSEVPAEALFKAWTDASRAVLLANEQVTGSWDLDMDWWPEGWTGDVWKDKSRFRTLEDTRKTEPMDGSKLGSIAETANDRHGDKVSAFVTSDQIDRLASNALSILTTLDATTDTELRLALQDLKAMAHLGHYNADKFRAAIYAEQGKKQEALAAITAAYIHWRRYTDLMDELYIGVDMQRNRSFPDWHAHDKAALQDYFDLGGVDEPDWQRSK